MSVAVITSCYGGYDKPRPPTTQDVECEWVLVTDVPVDVPGWRVVVEPRPHAHPRLAAKVAKFRPDLYSDADTLVWIDSHVVVHSDQFVGSLVLWLGDHDLAMFRHPLRQSILAEAMASAGLPKYDGQTVLEQAAHYVDEGHDPNYGLWCTGISVRRNLFQLRRFGENWLLENTRWTYQDQISLPPLIARHWTTIRMGDLPAEHWGGPLWGLTPHEDGSC